MKILLATIIVLLSSISHAAVFRMQYAKPKEIEALAISSNKDNLIILTIGRLETPKNGGYKAFDLNSTEFKSGKLDTVTKIVSLSKTNKKISHHIQLSKKLTYSELIAVEGEKEVVIYILSTEGIFKISYHPNTSKYKTSQVKDTPSKADLTILFADGKAPTIKRHNKSK